VGVKFVRTNDDCDGAGVRKTTAIWKGNPIMRRAVCSMNQVLPITGVCNQYRNPLEP
jgi:hypothetical protein